MWNTKPHEQTSTMINSCDVSQAHARPQSDTQYFNRCPKHFNKSRPCRLCRLDAHLETNLAEKGPWQLSLKKFSINEAIKKKRGNQLSFCSNWYSEYPYLEHSLKKNRAYFLRALSMARVSAPTKLRRRGFSVWTYGTKWKAAEDQPVGLKKRFNSIIHKTAKLRL